MFVCCDVIGKTCSKCGDACTACCGGCSRLCNWICPDDRPSPIFLIYSWILNIVTCSIAAVAVAKDGGAPCTSDVRTWYILVFIVTGINLGFSVYLYSRFTQRVVEEGESACTSASKLLLYDVGVYFYIWVVIFMIVWMSINSTLRGGERVCASMVDATTAIIICWIVYLVGGVGAMFLSVCATCCNEADIRRVQREGDAGGNEAAARRREDADLQRAIANSRTTTTAGGGAGGAYAAGRSGHPQNNQQRGEEGTTIMALAGNVIAGAAAFFSSALSGGGDNNSSAANPPLATIYTVGPTTAAQSGAPVVVVGQVVPPPTAVYSPHQSSSAQPPVVAHQPQWGV